MRTRLYEHQKDFLAKNPNRCLLAWATGCLSGDTVLKYNRAKITRTTTIKKMWKSLNFSKRINKNIDTYVQSNINGTIRLNKVKNIYYSGIKKTHTLVLKNKYSIRATGNHRILTQRGWVALKNLDIENDLVATNYYKNKPNTKIKFCKIKNITENGYEETYDIECEDPYNNYIAENIVVHNSGKSITAIEWAAIKRTQERHMNEQENCNIAALVIVPKALKANWQRYIDEYEYQWMWVMTKEEFRKLWDTLPEYKIIIVDECFPAGTKILTPIGYKNIENIKKGDKIISVLGEDVVTATSSRKSDDFIIINEKIKVTPNHPFLTKRGWVKAKDLKIGEIMLRYLTGKSIIENNEILQNVQKEKRENITRRNKNFLFSVLQDEVSMEYEKKRNEEKISKCAYREPSQSKKLFRKDEKEQSYKERRNKKKSFRYIKKNEAQTSSPRREWKKITDTTKKIIKKFRQWMEGGVCGKDKPRETKEDFTASLQNRYRSSRKNDSNRSRRQLSRFITETKTGREEGKNIIGIRVESIKSEKQKNTRVFNFSVKGHPSYVINDGILVHNCHYFSGMKSQMSKNLARYLRKWKVKYRLFLTATPYLSTPWNIYTLASHLGYSWSYGRFQWKYFNQIYIGKRTIFKPKKGIEHDIAKLVSSIGDIVRLDDCVDVPEQIFDIEYFDLTPEQEQAKKMVLETNPIVRYTKYHQIVNGTLKSDGYIDNAFYKNNKAERIKELAEENDKIAIVCRYNLQIQALHEELERLDKPVFIIQGKTKDRDSVTRAVEASEKAIVLINASCSEGYELPSVGVMVFASLPFSYKDVKQIQGRILRINKLKKNIYLYLIANDDIDKAVYQSIKNKEDFDIALYAQSQENMPTA